MNIIIDGKKIEAKAGETILEVARREGIPIPTLCYHEAFGGQGSCRLCTVEVKAGNVTRLAASCTYPITGEIEVRTSTPAVEKLRRNIIMLLYKRAPNSEFMKKLYEEYQCADNSLTSDPNECCILCRLCVLACDEMGPSAISIISRGTDKRIATPYDEASAACIGCGACAHICPTGAIKLFETDKERTLWSKTFELVHCKNCGQPYATREQLEYITSKTGMEDGNEQLCENCRKKILAAKLSQFTG